MPWNRVRATLPLLQERRAHLLLAVLPDQVAGLDEMVRACGDAGVPLGLWPMIEERDGRWASVYNAGPFGDHLHRVLERARGADELVFDFEPPIHRLRRLLRGRPLSTVDALRPLRAAAAMEDYAAMVESVRAAGLSPSAAVAPVAVFDPPGRAGPWQRFLGTPVDDLDLDRLHVMIYPSLLEGYGRWLVRRRDARSLAYGLARAAVHRYRDRLSVSLGVTGPGALGDERRYRGPHELAEDVAVVRAAGAHDLAVHGLRGMLDRGPAQRWLDAMRAAPADLGERSRRSLAMQRLGALAGGFGRR